MNTSPSPARLPRLLAGSLLLTLAAASGACANSEITGPIPGVSGMTTLNAAQSRQYFSLEQGSAVVVESPASSRAWDLSFLATSVTLNGGEAGPAGVGGYCVCQNASAGSPQILGMTPDSELADYEAVTLSDVPASSEFTAEVFKGNPWYKYNIAGDHRISPLYHVYLIKRDDAYYKLQITGYYSPTNAPRHITFRFQRLVR